MQKDLNELIDTSIPAIREWARQYQDIRAVLLFGSRFHRTHTQESDVDVCILLDQHAGQTWYSRWVNQSDKWKDEFSTTTAIPKSKLQFCTVTSVQVRKGLERGCRFLYLREDDPNRLRPVDYTKL